LPPGLIRGRSYNGAVVIEEPDMAASWITVVAPYLPEIIRLARPMFTRTPPLPDDSQRLRLDVVDTQIVELQDAASQNADSIAKLARDMQQTMQALQLGAERLERRLALAQRVTLVAITVAALSFCLAAWALAR